MNRWIATLLAAVAVLIALKTGGDAALAIAGLAAMGLSMIYRPSWWTFWMNLGFWEQRASDSGSADQMGPVIVFIGWIVLLLVLWLAFRL